MQQTKVFSYQRTTRYLEGKNKKTGETESGELINHQKCHLDPPRIFSGIPQATLFGSTLNQHRLDQSILHTPAENEYVLQLSYYYHRLLADDEQTLFPQEPPLYCIDNALKVQCGAVQCKSKSNNKAFSS